MFLPKIEGGRCGNPDRRVAGKCRTSPVAWPYVGRSQTRSAVLEPQLVAHPGEVTVEDYLAHHRALPHLVEVAPFQHPAAFGVSEPSEPDNDAAASVCDAVRTKGGPQADVRLLVDDGERHLPLAQAIARTLRCDVYLTPDGAHVRYVREAGLPKGDLWDAIATDRETGEPVSWQIVRPAELSAGVPTWFTTVRGKLRRSNGLVAVDLPDGIAFATKYSFRDAVNLAAHLRKNPNRLTTVAVNADLGRFEISRFDNAGSLLGGVELATLVGASLDLIHPDVQLALTWPTDAAAGRALHAELMRFADALNRTVWVPRPQGAAFILSGCGEFAAVDEVGGPSEWLAYPARLASQAGADDAAESSEDLTQPRPAHWQPHFRTDPDGRLVPLGEAAITAFDGMPFICVPASKLDRQRAWYASVTAAADLFIIDLAVLTDGRLGVVLTDGGLLAVAPRALRGWLRAAGWSNEDLVVLAQTSAPSWEETVRHVRILTDMLAVDAWLPAPEADVWARAEGGLAAQLPDGGEPWRCVLYRRGVDVDAAIPEGVERPVALTTSPPGEESGRRQMPVLAAEAQAPVEPPSRADASVVPEWEPAVQPPAAVEVSTFTEPSVFIEPADELEPCSYTESSALADMPGASGPDGIESHGIAPGGITVARVLGVAGPHGVPWLAPAPTVNSRALDLYVWTPLASDELESWGLPSADLFLLAGQDPLRLAEHRRDGYLLRIQAPPGAAVDLFDHIGQSPALVRERLSDSGCTHLLPLAWLSDLRVAARYDLDGYGGVAARDDLGVGPLQIRFEGASHGVPGLPNEVVHWPDKGQRAGVPSYLLLPEELRLDRPVAHGGFVALSRNKPELVDGHCLLEVKVRKRKAIDIPATLDSLDGLPVLGRMHDFVGLDLLLPTDDLAQALVPRVWRPGPTGRPVVDKLAGETLSDLLQVPELTSA